MSNEAFAKQVVTKYATVIGKENAAFDPAIILVVSQIIEQVIAMLQDCKKTPSQTLQAAKAPSVWERLVVRQQCIDVMGRREFRDNGGPELVSSIFSAASGLDVKTVEKMFDVN